MACEKRGFRGKRSAMNSIGKLHHTVHVYRCEDCRLWHIAKRDRRRTLKKRIGKAAAA